MIARFILGVILFWVWMIILAIAGLEASGVEISITLVVSILIAHTIVEDA